MRELREDIGMLRFMLSVLLENEGRADLSPARRDQYKKGIRALKRAIEAVEGEVLA